VVILDLTSASLGKSVKYGRIIKEISEHGIFHGIAV
jgi:hypothetical protein